MPRPTDERGLYSRKNADGKVRWYVRAAVHGRMQHFGSFPTKTSAREFYQRAKTISREQRLTPGATLDTDLTIPELFARYLPQAAHRRAYREQQRFADWWIAYWPHQRLFDLAPASLEQARVDLRTSGRLKQRREGTVNHYLKTLKHAMRAVVQPRSWVIDLWSQLKLDRPDGTPPIPITPADEQLILAQLSPDDADKVRLATLTGLRRAQLFGIRWEHVLWTQHGLALPSVKRQRPRFIPIAHEAQSILQRWWTRAGQPSSGWVFPHATDQDLPEDPGSWYKYRFKKAVTAAGLDGKGLKFHSTRHTFASRFIEAGGNARSLQQAGGWSSLSQVEIYTQLNDTSMRDAMNNAAKIGARNSRKLQNPRPKKSKKSS